MKRILIIPATAALLTGLSATAQDFNDTADGIKTPTAVTYTEGQASLDGMTIEELNALQLQRLQSPAEMPAESADTTFQVAETVAADTETEAGTDGEAMMAAETEADAETDVDADVAGTIGLAEDVTTLDEPGAHETISDETGIEVHTETDQSADAMTMPADDASLEAEEIMDAEAGTGMEPEVTTEMDTGMDAEAEADVDAEIETGMDTTNQ